MVLKNPWRGLLLACFFGLVSAGVYGEEPADVRLYALASGMLYDWKLEPLFEGDRFKGKSKDLVIPAFLIRHPKGDLLWDAGLPKSLVNEAPDAEYRFSETASIPEQLKFLNMAPADIEFLALSHTHPDHAGNAGLFAGATFLVHEREWAWLMSDEHQTAQALPDVYRRLKQTKTIQFKAPYDVFGDGRVVIFPMPGHTPGHCVLLLRLAQSGALLLSGDLYVFAELRGSGLVPNFDWDQQVSRTSIAAFEALADKEKARVVVQHDVAHFKKLPAFPRYLD